MSNNTLSVVVSGQKKFGKAALKLCEQAGLTIRAVVCPLTDHELQPYAENAGYKIIPAGTLSAETMPADVDLGICAHSFDYVGRRTRYKTKIGWIGYHPSLLPRHRGRSSIGWALRMKDIVIGGTVYWLDDGIDRGDIAYQDWRWLDHNKTAKQVWDEDLMPLGVQLLQIAINDIKAGTINRVPQSILSSYSTFEPSLENVKDVYKPDLLMLEAKNGNTAI